MASPQKPQHRERTGSSLSVVIGELELCSLLEQSARGVFLGVHQGCLLSPVLLNLILKRIRQETLHDYQTSIPIGVKPIFNMRFADDTNLMGGSSDELQDLTNRLVDRAMVNGMAVSTENRQIMS